MQTIKTEILEELANVGNRSVTIRLDFHLYPVDLVHACADRYGRDLSVSRTGELTVATGPQARETLRQFTKDFIAALLERE